MTLTMPALFATLLFQAPPPPANTYDARLGQFYLIGATGKVTGALQLSREVSITGARTAIAIGNDAETLVAGEGKKLVIVESTIRNPEPGPIQVTNGSSYGIRVYDLKANPGDIRYLGAWARSGGRLDVSLKHGETVDLVSVWEFPAVTPTLRIGPHFYAYYPKTTPKFDLADKFAQPTSVFARDNLTYAATAEVTKGQVFDLDGLEFRVLGAEPFEKGSYRVRIEVRNPMPAAGRWGWQYAKATMIDAAGTATDYYPDFVVLPEFADWGMTIKPGQTIVGEYRFTPPGGAPPRQFKLIANATHRTVVVTGL